MSNIRVFGPPVHENNFFYLNSLFLPLFAPYGAQIGASPFIFANLNPYSPKMLPMVPNLVEISSVVLEKKSFQWKVYTGRWTTDGRWSL